MASSSEAQIKSEIERLTATINQHKAQKNKTWNSGYGYSSGPHSYGGHHSGSVYHQGGPPTRTNSYVNPNYRPANKYVRPGSNPSSTPVSMSASTAASTSTSTSTATTTATMAATSTGTAVAGSLIATGGSPAIPPAIPPARPTSAPSGPKKEVVLGGVAFESSRRSLVRKDLPKPLKPISSGPPAPTSVRPHPYARKPGHVPLARAFKLKARRGRNMTLDNTRRPYQSKRTTSKRVNKYIDKPCPRFTTTGACSRGLTCPYQHDPSKIAICWSFLQDNCSNTAETCNLSHDPTPERTPLCVHFLNKGRCTRQKCPFPHVNVGPRQGVCRDFAVLGYCDRGLECEHQHVRECPDFAEKGTCETRGCKLPHVIRANRNRKVAAPTLSSSVKGDDKKDTSIVPATAGDAVMLTAEDGQLGDEYISLTFKESDSEEESDEDESMDEDEGESGSEDGDEDESMLQVHT